MKAFIPYMSPVETSTSSQQGANASPLPPLQPTGFVQNEQGMLIPLYRNEALNQYLAATSSRSPGETGVTYWSNSPAWQPPPPWLPQQAITPTSPATQSIQAYPHPGYTQDVESMGHSPQAAHHQHHSSVSPHPHNTSAVPTQYLTPKLEPAQPSLNATNTQVTPNQTPSRGRTRNNPHNPKPIRNVHHPHSTNSDTRTSGHGPTFQQMVESKLVHPIPSNANQGRPLSTNASPVEAVSRPYNHAPMYPGYSQPYDQYIMPFPAPTPYPLSQHMQPPSNYPRGVLMQSQWTAVPPAYENV